MKQVGKPELFAFARLQDMTISNSAGVSHSGQPRSFLFPNTTTFEAGAAANNVNVFNGSSPRQLHEGPDE